MGVDLSARIMPLHGYDVTLLDPTGGGDSVGDYVPVGCEAHPPIVCVHEHPISVLFPVASSSAAAEALARSRLLVPPDDDEEVGDLDEDGLVPLLRCAWLSDDLPVDALLEVDPASPLLLARAAKLALRNGDRDRAVALLERSVAVLPEYGDAWATLASALAPVDRVASSTALSRALRSPIAFSWFLDRKRLVKQLARAPSRGVDDALFARRTQLTGAMREGDPSDAIALEEASDDDLARGRSDLALIALMTAGELMLVDTHSCRERRGWSERAHIDRMRAACVASLSARSKWFQMPGRGR